MFDIDLVVPYVDMEDENWITLAKQNGIKIQKERFRGQGSFFKYFFRCIDKNLPWINNLFLIVQSDSQVPDFINTSKVKIIKHDDFIPKEFLPVYSSCTIEMFLQNIPGLSEHFLYFNDDVFVIKPLLKTQFFIEDKVCQSFTDRFPIGIYGNHVKNGCRLIFGNDIVISMNHSIKTLLKSKCIECFNIYKNEILNSISKTRTEFNFNVYLFSFYLRKIGKTTRSKIHNSLYFRNMPKCLDSKFNQVLCINDDGSDFSVYDDEKLNTWFKNNFKDKSKYEK